MKLPYSEVNRGTRFDLYLPRFQEGNTVVAPATVNGGGETVLLVDDEAMIRNLGRTIL